MKKKIALLLCAAMVLALTACTSDKEPETPDKPATVTATPTPGQKQKVTATPTAVPTKNWSTPLPTFTPTPEQLAAIEAEKAKAAFNKTYVLDLSKAFKVDGEAPTLNDDGTLSLKGGVTAKIGVPLGVIAKEGTKAVATITMQFNDASDEAVRFWGLGTENQGTNSNVVKVMNPGNTNEYVTTIDLAMTKDADALLIGASGWGVKINDVTIKRVTIAPDPKIDLTQEMIKISGDLPTLSADNTVVAKGGVTQKFAYPLGKTYHDGDVLVVTAKVKFNKAKAEEERIRFYGVLDAADSATSNVALLYNPDNKKTTTETLVLNLTKDTNQLLISAGGWGQSIQDVEIKSLSVQQAEVLDLSKAFKVDGDAATLNDDGTLSIKGGVTAKIGVPVERTNMSAGTGVTGLITMQFNDASDEAVRFWGLGTENQGTNSNVVLVSNPGKTDEFVAPIEITMTKDADALLLGAAKWGVKINDVLVKKIVLYETPVVIEEEEETTPDDTPKTGDNSLAILLSLLGVAAVSGVVFFKKR